jgi:hypothetical protein
MFSKKNRFVLRALICAAAPLGLLLAVSPALAATASMPVTKGGQVHVLYEADVGEANNVTISQPTASSPFYIDDPGASIVPSAGCWTITASRVACQGGPVTKFILELKDQDDRAMFNVNVHAEIRGGDGADILYGGPATDFLSGDYCRCGSTSGGDDQLLGRGDRDFLVGEVGNDRLDGGPGRDEFHGGSGIDTADYSSRTARVDVNLVVAYQDGEAGEDDNVRDDVENIRGGSGDDVLTGNSEPNRLEGNWGTDRLDGGGGNDLLDGGDGGDTGDVYLDDGDTLIGGNGPLDYALYDTRNTAVTVTLDGVANDGRYGEGDNVGVDVEGVVGGNGNDTLIGNGRVTNFLYGGPGEADRLDGGDGACGYANGYVLCQAPFADFLDGGPGTGDTADYSSRDAALSLTLDGVDNDGAVGEQDQLWAVENLVGGSGDDYISGNASSNRLTGGPGADGLYGWGGPDFIDSRDWQTDYLYCGDALDEALDDDIDEAPTGECETRALLSSEVFGGR